MGKVDASRLQQVADTLHAACFEATRLCLTGTPRSELRLTPRQADAEVRRLVESTLAPPEAPQGWTPASTAWVDHAYEASRDLVQALRRQQWSPFRASTPVAASGLLITAPLVTAGQLAPWSRKGAVHVSLGFGSLAQDVRVASAARSEILTGLAEAALAAHPDVSMLDDVLSALERGLDGVGQGYLVGLHAGLSGVVQAVSRGAAATTPERPRTILTDRVSQQPLRRVPGARATSGTRVSRQA